MNRHKMWRLLVWIFLGNLGFDWRPSIFTFSMGFARNVFCFLLLVLEALHIYTFENWRHWLLEPEWKFSESYLPFYHPLPRFWGSVFSGCFLCFFFFRKWWARARCLARVEKFLVHQHLERWQKSTSLNPSIRHCRTSAFWETWNQCFFESSTPFFSGTLITGLGPCWENFGWDGTMCETREFNIYVAWFGDFPAAACPC